MVIHWTERELASPCNRLSFANGIRRLLNDTRLKFWTKSSLSPAPSLRWWPAYVNDVSHELHLGLYYVPSARFWLFMTSLWTHIDCFTLLASHLTVLNCLSLVHWDASPLSVWWIIINYVHRFSDKRTILNFWA